MEHALTPFEGTEIRKIWYNEEWYFSVVDVIGFLTDSTNPASYWHKVQKNILSDSQLLPFWQKLKLVGQDGKARPSDCAHTEGILRIVMSVPSPMRARLNLAMPLDEWRLNVAESVFWFGTIGAGESTLIDFERPLTQRHVFRASSNATWLNNTQYFDLSQSFSVYHAYDERTALLYQIGVVGVSRPQMQVSDYVILTTYRYRWHREWVYIEISPQIHFPQVENYKISKLLSLRLEFLFDQSR